MSYSVTDGLVFRIKQSLQMKLQGFCVHVKIK